MIQVNVKGLAIILQLKEDHPICPKINEEPAGIITMHLIMLLLLWHAVVKLIIVPSNACQHTLKYSHSLPPFIVYCAVIDIGVSAQNIFFLFFFELMKPMQVT